MCILASDLWIRTVDLQSWSRKGFGKEMTGTQWSGLAWSVRSSAEVSAHVSSHFFALNERRDRQTELRIAATWKSTTSIKQQKKEKRLHSKRSPCKNRDGKIFATKCRQKHICGGIALLAMSNMTQVLTLVSMTDELLVEVTLPVATRPTVECSSWRPSGNDIRSAPMMS